MELTVTGSEPIVIGATGLEEIAQNIRTIILTTAYQVPLDRAFAHTNAFLDSPSPAETARLVSELAEAIEEGEPRVKVDSIELTPIDEQMGSYAPVVTYHLRESL